MRSRTSPLSALFLLCLSLPLTSCGGERLDVTLTPAAVQHPVGARFMLFWSIPESTLDSEAVRGASLRWDTPRTRRDVVDSTDPQFDDVGYVHRHGAEDSLQAGYTLEFTCVGRGSTTIALLWEMPPGSPEQDSDTVSVVCGEPLGDGGPDSGLDGGVPTDAGSPPDAGPLADAAPVDAGPPASDGGVAAARMVRPAGLDGIYAEAMRVGDERLFALFSVAFPIAGALVDATILSGSHDTVWGGGKVTGAGDEFEEITDVARIDGSSTGVLDSGTETVVRVDHDNALRTIISGGGVGSGPAFDSPHSIVYDARTGLAYVANSPFGGESFILSVDVGGGGDRVEIWRSADGRLCTALALDAANDDLLTFLANDPTAIHIPTGAETQLADFVSGPDTPQYAALQMDPIANRLAMVSNNPVGFSFLDLGTGEVLVVSSADRGAGPAFVRLTDLLYFSAQNLAFVTDASQANVMQIDTVTGDRAHVTAPE